MNSSLLTFFLGELKIRFIAQNGGGGSLVGPFLEMSMLPELEMRRICIPIIFDMMQCEFYSVRSRVTSGSSLDPSKVEERIKGKFDQVTQACLDATTICFINYI